MPTINLLFSIIGYSMLGMLLGTYGYISFEVVRFVTKRMRLSRAGIAGISIGIIAFSTLIGVLWDSPMFRLVVLMLLYALLFVPPIRFLIFLFRPKHPKLAPLLGVCFCLVSMMCATLIWFTSHYFRYFKYFAGGMH